MIRITLRSAVVVMLVAVGSLLFASPAASQQAEPELSKDTGLLAGEEIEVTIAGLERRDSYTVEQCGPNPSRFTGCLLHVTKRSADDGTFVAKFAPRPTIDGGTSVTDCTKAACMIQVRTQSGSVVFQPLEITFAESVEGNPTNAGLKLIEMETAGPLIDLQRVALNRVIHENTYYTPQVLQCVENAGHIGTPWCQRLAMTLSPQDNGYSQIVVRPRRHMTFVRPNAGTHRFDCADTETVCVLVEDNLVPKRYYWSAISDRLTFDPTTSKKQRVRLSQRRDLDARQQVTITSKNHFGSSIKVLQCVRADEETCTDLKSEAVDPNAATVRTTVKLARSIGSVGAATDCTAGPTNCVLLFVAGDNAIRRLFVTFGPPPADAGWLRVKDRQQVVAGEQLTVRVGYVSAQSPSCSRKPVTPDGGCGGQINVAVCPRNGESTVDGCKSFLLRNQRVSNGTTFGTFRPTEVLGRNSQCRPNLCELRLFTDKIYSDRVAITFTD